MVNKLPVEPLYDPLGDRPSGDLDLLKKNRERMTRAFQALTSRTPIGAGLKLLAPTAAELGAKAFKFTQDTFGDISKRISLEKANDIVSARLGGMSLENIKKEFKAAGPSINKVLNEAEKQGAIFPLPQRLAKEAANRQKAEELINYYNTNNIFKTNQEIAKEAGFKNAGSISNLKLPVKIKEAKDVVQQAFDDIMNKGNVDVSQLRSLRETIRSRVGPNVGGRKISDVAISQHLNSHQPYLNLKGDLDSVSAKLKGGDAIPPGTTFNQFLKDRDAGMYPTGESYKKRRKKMSSVTNLQVERELAGSRRLDIELHHADSKRFNVTTRNLMYVEGRKNRGIIKAAENKINKLYGEREELVRQFVTTGKKPEGYVKRLIAINREGAKLVNDPKVKGFLNFQEFNPKTLAFVDEGVDFTKTLAGMSGIDAKTTDITRDQLKELIKYRPPKKQGGRVGYKNGGLVFDPNDYIEHYSDGTKLYKIKSFIKDIAKAIP